MATRFLGLWGFQTYPNVNSLLLFLKMSANHYLLSADRYVKQRYHIVPVTWNMASDVCLRCLLLDVIHTVILCRGTWGVQYPLVPAPVARDVSNDLRDQAVSGVTVADCGVAARPLWAPFQRALHFHVSTLTEPQKGRALLLKCAPQTSSKSAGLPRVCRLPPPPTKK